MPFPYRPPFSIDLLINWVALHCIGAHTGAPLPVRMTDQQYAHYAHLMRGNKRDVQGIPIEFIDGPKV